MGKGINCDNSFKNIRIKIATPTIDGSCHIQYHLSCLGLVTDCMDYNIPINFEFEVGNSLLPLARNNLAAKFEKSDFTHLLMVDADTTFHSKDILKLLSFDKDVIGGVVSKKKLDWGNIKQAAKEKNVEADMLPYFGAVNNFIPYSDKDGSKVEIGQKANMINRLTVGDPIRVASIGTAIMLIKKSVFKKMKKTYSELSYYDFDNEEQKTAYFEMSRTSKGILMSEDVSFCQRVNDMGMEVWAYPWMETFHHGKHTFLADMNKWV